MTIITKKTANVDLKEGPIEVRSQTVDGWNVSFESWPRGDYRALFQGLPGDACLVPHYGYCLKGKAKAIYNDGTEDLVEEGQAYVLRPGHTFVVLEPFENVEFTQLTPEYAQVGEAFMKNFQGWLKASAKR